MADLNHSHATCFTSHAWRVSPVAAVGSVILAKLTRSWTPFKIGVVVGTLGDLGWGYWR